MLVRKKRANSDLGVIAGYYSPKHFNYIYKNVEEIINTIGSADEAYNVADDCDVFEDVCLIEMKYNIQEALNMLSKREAEAIKLSYGFYGKEYTLSQIGKKLKNQLNDKRGISKERVRLIICRAISKLRYPSRSAKLRGLL